MPTLYQYSHFLAVSEGCYDGDITIGQLKKQGNMGLGSFNALDGELVAIGNVFYHCAGGEVRVSEDSELLNWAAITMFEQIYAFSLNKISSLSQLQDEILKNLLSYNYLFAFIIKAQVNNIALGSVPKQQKPYRGIAEVIEESILINTGKLEANIVGFYAPSFMYPIKSSGLHLHFVDYQACLGGHVLDIDLIYAEIYWQQLNSFNLILPQNEDYKSAIINRASETRAPVFSDKLQQRQKR